MNARLLAAALGLLLIPGLAAAQPATLALSFDLAQPKGAVLIAVFDSPEGYKASRPVESRRLELGAGEPATVFAGLKPGRYAVQAFQDLDGDGKMNRNLMGMPTEPYGFSNKAVPNMGPPGWDEAAFDLAAAGAAQRLRLR